MLELSTTTEAENSSERSLAAWPTLRGDPRRQQRRMAAVSSATSPRCTAGPFGYRQSYRLCPHVVPMTLTGVIPRIRRCQRLRHSDGRRQTAALPWPPSPPHVESSAAPLPQAGIHAVCPPRFPISTSGGGEFEPAIGGQQRHNALHHPARRRTNERFVGSCRR